MARSAIAILSTENLLHNLSALKSAAPNSEVIAMIKANGYGHGLRSVAKRLDGKVNSLGVASIDEAVALRNVGIKVPITLMSGPFEHDDVLISSCQDFHLVIHEMYQIDWIRQIYLPNKIFVWLKIDTGMGRLGFKIEQVPEIYRILSNCNNIQQPIGIMSHFACSENKDHLLNKTQLDQFNNFISSIPGKKSIANSGAIFNFPNAHHDMIRPGISLYGISPVENKTAAELGLKPVMTLQTRLVAISSREQGSSVGYGARYICPQEMRVGVIAMGYGDGYPRTAKDGTPVLVNNRRCKIVGRVSMDMATIDLRNCPDAKIGDPVILWGDGLPIEEVAAHTANIPYDIICGVQQRVKFYWTV